MTPKRSRRAQLLYIDPAVFEGHFSRGQRKVRKSIRAADIFRIFKKCFRVEAAYFATDFAVVSAGIECFYLVNTAYPIL